MTVGMVAFWGLVIWATVLLVRSGSTQPAPSADAESILAARFAADEIDEDEYQRRLDTLRAERGHVARPEMVGHRP